MIKMACAFTGHRPERFSFGYDESDERCLRIKSLMAEWITAFIIGGVRTFYTGMALGIDQWAASIVLNMKQQHSGIRLIALVPCKTQADRWSEKQRGKYEAILAECDNVQILNDYYTRGCMHQRNRVLVESAAYLLAVYDGGEDGGTAYTVDYARKNNRQITIIHPDTLAVDSFTDTAALRRRGEIHFKK